MLGVSRPAVSIKHHLYPSLLAVVTTSGAAGSLQIRSGLTAPAVQQGQGLLHQIEIDHADALLKRTQRGIAIGDVCKFMASVDFETPPF
jgi:hypothetical protein